MYLLEHDAKELLRSYDIPAPQGRLIARDDTIVRGTLPPGPWIVKGQIAAGGRGKAGIIRKAASTGELSSHTAEILGSTVKGREVTAVRIEQQVAGGREVYIGFLLDAAGGGVRVIVSASGGMDIEQISHDQIHSALAQPEEAALKDCVQGLARKLPPELARAVSDAGGKLAHAFLALEAMLLEINPLFVLADGSWVAGDAKLVTDDNALPRQKGLESIVKARASDYTDVARKHEHGFDYVVVDPAGEIGLLTTGAGLSMMLIDEMRSAGLKPYNFLDIRTGGLRGETRRLTQVLKWIGEGRNVKVLLVNIFAGITDLGEFSRLLVAALGPANLKIPVVARLVGTNLSAARENLAAANIPLHIDLDAALADVRARLDEGTRAEG
ncbi:MAG TPA: ATP-grasp domain-containing protein [Burkholderiales bacterium]|nr:ATP-grasp domain-containing protein [Burkholderiales bacterium]